MWLILVLASSISYSATVPLLGDKRRFPYFFRTISSDIYQIKAIIKLLEYNQWDYVSFIHEDNDYGNAAYETFINEIERTTICLGREVQIRREATDDDLLDYVKKLNSDERARVVIAFVKEYNLVSMFKLMHEHQLLMNYQFIGSDSWTYLSSDFSVYTNDTNVEVAIHDILNGAIVFSGHLPDNNFSYRFESYIRNKTLTEAKESNPFFADYLSFVNGCSEKVNDTNECSDDLTLPIDEVMSSMLTSASTAVYSFAKALDNARQDFCEEGIHISQCVKFTTMCGSEMREYLQNVSLSLHNTTVFNFNENQDGPPWYNIWRYNKTDRGHWENIGYFQNNKIEVHSHLSENLLQGKENMASTCSDECSENQYMDVRKDKKCCWTCHDCDVNSIVVWNNSLHLAPKRNVSNCLECKIFEFALKSKCLEIPDKFLSFSGYLAWCVAAGSCLGLILTFIAALTYVFAWDTPLIRASGRELCVIILVGLVLMFSVCFLFCFKPTTLLCSMRRVGIGICFSIVYSSLVVKTMRISFIFNTLGKKLIRNYKRFLEPLPQVIIALSLASLELFVIGIWFVHIPSEVIRKTNTTSSEEIRNQFTVIFVDCKGLKSHDLLIGLSYPIGLLLICTVYAIKIRKVPAGFNEAKHIGFVVYTTLVIWLAQLSTYFVLTSTDVVFRDTVYCLGLCLNGFIIILALFGPKLYIVLLRPEKNNQRTVMGAGRSYSTLSQRENNPNREISNLSVEEIKPTFVSKVLPIRKFTDLTHDELVCCPHCGLKFLNANVAISRRRKSLPEFLQIYQVDTLRRDGNSFQSTSMNYLSKKTTKEATTPELQISEKNNFSLNTSILAEKKSPHEKNLNTISLKCEKGDRNSEKNRISPDFSKLERTKTLPSKLQHGCDNLGFENDTALIRIGSFPRGSFTQIGNNFI